MPTAEKDIALNKSVAASSVLGSHVPEKAVDGIYDLGEYFHSRNDEYHGTGNLIEWLEVDLGTEYLINELIIYNRIDSPANSLDNLYVEFSLAQGFVIESLPYNEFVSDIKENLYKKSFVDAIRARYIKVNVPNATNEY
eukprot:Awhi_evm1s11855